MESFRLKAYLGGLGDFPFPFRLSLGQELVPRGQRGDAPRRREGAESLSPAYGQAPLAGDDDRAWCLAQLSLSKCLAASVFLGTCKRHENDFRKQVVLAKYCVRCPANRSAWEETFLGGVEGEEEENSCAFFYCFATAPLSVYHVLKPVCLLARFSPFQIRI